MKTIKLNNGYSSIVDDDDYDQLANYKWTVMLNKRGNVYAVTNMKINGRLRAVLMHRYILKVEDPKVFVDHKDHNGLNNQKNNIRLCNNSQNQMNKKPIGTSRYMGVSYSKQKKKWVSQININGKTKYLGRYNSEIECAIKYDEYAKIYHGEFANLNFK